MLGCDFARFALDPVAEEDAVVAGSRASRSAARKASAGRAMS